MKRIVSQPLVCHSLLAPSTFTFASIHSWVKSARNELVASSNVSL